MNKEEQKYTNAQILRKKAEDLLSKKQSFMDLNVKGMDEKILLHELQVYQIELEMQNEELLREIEIAEKALKKNSILFDLAPLGYFNLNASGNIKDTNQAGADILGDKKYNLVNTDFDIYVAEKGKTIFEDFLKKAFESFEKVSCQVMLEKKNKPLCFVYMEGIVIPDEEICLLSVVDISGSSSSHHFQIPIF